MPTHQILGQLDTGIVGTRHHNGILDPGARVRLVREPENARDPNAIRADNAAGESVGYLPRRTAAWLAPLLDGRRISLKARQPVEGPDAPVPIHVDVPLVLDVRLLTRGRGILHKPGRQPGTELEVLHEIVRRVFVGAEHYSDPDLPRVLAGRLQPLVEGRLHPETRLLLALLPSRGRTVVEAFRSLNGRDPARRCPQTCGLTPTPGQCY